MELRYFDVHSHIQDTAFDADREAVLSRMKEEGVGALVVGTDRKMSEDAVALAEKHDFLWATIGQHPTDSLKAVRACLGKDNGIVANTENSYDSLRAVGAGTGEEFDHEFYLRLAKHPKVVAIGECGLDYYRGVESRKSKVESHASEIERQKRLFCEHIKLALEVKKPLMLHCRPTPGTLDAYEDILSILTTNYQLLTTNYPGNIHFFVGSSEIADKFLALGFTLSFTGVITFPPRLAERSRGEAGAGDYDEVIKRIPFDRLLLETDCPYVAPVPYRGKRNEPVYIKEIAAKMAEIRGESREIVADATVKNALRGFLPSVRIDRNF